MADKLTTPATADDREHPADRAVRRMRQVTDPVAASLHVGPEVGPPPSSARNLDMILARLEQLEDTVSDLSGGGGGGGGTITPAFELSIIDADNIQVRAGAVANVVATGTATNIDINGSDGTKKIFLDCTIDTDGLVTAVAVDWDDTAVPSDTSTHAYLLIGEAVVASAVVTSVTTLRPFSKDFIACGRDTADSTTTPGTYHFGIS